MAKDTLPQLIEKLDSLEDAAKAVLAAFNETYADSDFADVDQEALSWLAVITGNLLRLEMECVSGPGTFHNLMTEMKADCDSYFAELN